MRLRKLPTSVLAGLLVHTCCALAGPLEEACARQLAPTQIQVVPAYAQPVGHYGQSYKELTQRAPMPGQGWTTLGLTEASLVTNIEYGYSGLAMGTSGCSRPHIKVTLSFNPLLVYVGKEFKPGTCEFQHIFEHEQRHVVANQAHLGYVAGRLQAEMEHRFGNTIFYGDPKVVGAGLMAEVKDVWAPRAKAWMGLVKETHARIDSPQEYSRTATACGGAIARVLVANR